MRATNRLTALAVQRATKRGMYGDGAGLYLQVAEGGSKSWILRFKRGGRTRHFGIGPLHVVSLAEARLRASVARLMLLDGRDPIEARRASRAATAKVMTFDQCAAAYIAAHRPGWTATHAEQWRQTIATFANPVIGDMDVRAIETADVMRVLGDLWKQKTITASRLRGRIEAILDWARVRGYRTGENPARWRGHLDHLLPPKRKVRPVRHFAALPYSEIAAFMTDLRKRDGVSARALGFAILTATRSGETLGCAWAEIDLGQKLWVIPSTRTKAAKEHRVPLSDRAIAILSEMSAIRGGSDFVFSARRGRPLAKLALFNALRRMGRGDLTAHGFRSTFRDWAGNETAFPRELAEQALGHAIGDETERSYRRGDALERRRAMMDAWASYCDQPSAERGRVIALGSGRRK